MATVEKVELRELYQADETAWLERMAALAAARRLSEMDLENLSKYLSDMARRDRREAFSRLVVLLTHLLKWEQQPERRGGSWRGTIREQQRELRQLLESGTLRAHAESVFADAWRQAADEMDIEVAAFAPSSSWGLDEALGGDEA